MKSKDISTIRQALLDDQDGLCAICKRVPLVPCLDHNHRTGAIRGTLCRGCNSMEGKITTNAPRSQIKDIPAYLRGLADYLEKHQTDQTGLIHPAHNRKSRATNVAKLGKDQPRPRPSKAINKINHG